jgi:uncharacterized membrane protein
VNTVSTQASTPPQASTARRARGPGLLRLWELLFALNALVCIVALMSESQTSLPLTFDTALVLADSLLSGVALWLIMQRKKATRTVLCVYTAVMLIIGITGDLIINNFRFSAFYLVNHGRSLFLLACIYLIFSQRARTVLVMPFDLHGGREYAASEWALYRPRDPLFWRDIALFFMVFSVAGHWLERLYGIVVRYTTGFYDPAAPFWGSYFEPFSIYGIGAVLCILLLFPLKQLLAQRLRNIWLVLLVVYAANTVVCAGVELVIGLLSNHPGPTGALIYWDYSTMPFNFMGQICLQNSLGFGLAATVLVWALFPTIERLILACTKDVMNVISVVIVIVYLMLAALYLVKLP